MRHPREPELAEHWSADGSGERRVSEGLREDRCVVTRRGADEKKRERNGSEDTPANRQASRLSTSGQHALGHATDVDRDIERREPARKYVIRKLGHLPPPLT